MAVVLGITTSFTTASGSIDASPTSQVTAGTVDAQTVAHGEAIQATPSRTHVFRTKAHTQGRPYLKSDTRSHPDSFHTVVFAIKQNNVDKLEDELMKVSDPSSPHYGQHWTR